MSRKGDDLGRIEFFVPLPHRALRVNSRTQARGWRAKLKNDYQEQVWCAGHTGIRVEGGLDEPWGRARLTLEWRHAGVAPDPDNALASLKPLIDVLHTRSNRPLGIVVDDSPEHLTIEPVRCVKVAHRNLECVYVEIEEVR